MAFALIAALVGLALGVISLVLRPSGKKQRPDELQQLEAPTSGEGKFAIVVFGEIEVEAPNVIWYGDRYVRVHEEKV